MPLQTFAYTNSDVVINEIAWGGSSDESNDEWIELYNNTDEEIDLSGFSLVDDGGPLEISSGVIAPHGFFLIEDKEEAVNTVSGDLILGLSLANSGDSIVLKDASGNTIDSVNSSGDSWDGGDNETRATMERVDPRVSGDNPENWKSCEKGNGAKGRSGAEILGTPKNQNSVYEGGIPVEMTINTDLINLGDRFEISVSVESVSDLYSYGMEIDYDSTFFKFIDATEGDFLKKENSETSFFANLENNEEGKLILGGTILSAGSGVTGSGKIFGMEFETLKDSGETSFDFGGGNFLATKTNDIEASFGTLIFSIGESISENVNDENPAVPVFTVDNAAVELGENRYALEINWDEVSGASKYIVMREMPDGNFVTIGETQETDFVDDDTVTLGGKIIPGITYNYKIIPIKNDVNGNAVSVSGIETRGILGDNNRSDRVDGRDLAELAKAYAYEYGEENYNMSADTNYDGIVDGSDLIDLGANFGITYE